MPDSTAAVPSPPRLSRSPKPLVLGPRVAGLGDFFSAARALSYRGRLHRFHHILANGGELGGVRLLSRTTVE